MSNSAQWYCLSSFNLPVDTTFSDLWPYFKVIAVSNSFDWKFYCFVQLGWNFVSTSSWIYCFWLPHVFKRDNGCSQYFWIWQKHWLCLEHCLVEARSLNLRKLLFGVYRFISGPMILTLFQDHICERNLNLQIVFLRFLSSVNIVPLLSVWKGHTQYALCCIQVVCIQGRAVMFLGFFFSSPVLHLNVSCLEIIECELSRNNWMWVV